MRMKRLKTASLMTVLVLTLAGAFLLAGCAGTGKGAPEMTNCDAKITWEVVKEAKITQFDCAVGQEGGQAALIFTVGLENTTATPLRYRLNIFLEDMDKAFGALVPRKGKPPVIEPGKSETVKLPFLGTDKESKKILVVVKIISSE
jgi:hypothetical protein